MFKDIITATDITNASDIVKNEIENSVVKYVKARILKYFKNKNITPNENEKLELYNQFIEDDETQKYKELQTSKINDQILNLFTLRDNIDGINEIHHLYSELEQLKIISYDHLYNFKTLVEKITTKLPNNKSQITDFKELIKKFINSYSNISLNFSKNYSKLFDEKEPLKILTTMRDLYKIPKTIDSIELYDKYNMMDNLDMSNLLSDICFKHNEENIFNKLNINKSFLGNLLNAEIIKSEKFGQLLRNTTQQNTKITPEIPIVTNNAVTCYENTWTTNQGEFINKRLYATRTIGELLLEITNDNLFDQQKHQRQQIYMTYDGIRPSANDYWKWNGLQIIDIDPKKWVSDGGNIIKLRDKLYEELCQYHWFLFICFSSSGKGIHIWTKVSPPPNVYLKDSYKNNKISHYWHSINYYTKASVVYSIIYNNRDLFKFSEENGDFIIASEESKYSTGFELKHLDNSVGRITSGIRLTYDKNPLINNNFLDLPVPISLAETFDKFGDKNHINRIFLRNTPISNKFFEFLDELIVEFNDDKSEDKTDKVKIPKYILEGNDLSKLKELPVQFIKYRVRYEVCNTLANLYGKDGLNLAHTVLRSKECKNEKEINAFYAAAIRNRKESSKYGLDILRKCGIISYIQEEFKEELVDKEKLFLKKQIESYVDTNEQNYDLYLNDNEYLGHREYEIVKFLRHDKINEIQSPPGTGKCLGKDTPVLMYDGSIKMVQDIVVGDVVMGWDSTPRNVLSTTKGQEEMFKVIPYKGMTWTCNKSHIMTMLKPQPNLYREGNDWNGKAGTLPNKDIIIDKTIDETLKMLSLKTRACWPQLFRVPVEFQEKEILIDPYYLGYWLGDGCSTDYKICVSEPDLKYVEKYFKDYADRLNLSMSKYTNYRNNKGYHNMIFLGFPNKDYVKGFKTGRINSEKSILTRFLIDENLIKNKHIPKNYLVNSRNNRLKLLAGLIDSDGTKIRSGLSFSNINLELIKSVKFLAQSLGYYASIIIRTDKRSNKKYHSVDMYGDFSDLIPYLLNHRKIPDYCNKKSNNNPLRGKFLLESIGIGDYYGFTLAGDGRFLLGDFTVTHNTEIVKQISRDKRVLLILPFISIIKNKIETDPEIMSIFECYYDDKNINNIEYGINCCVTFDKFAKSSYEKISRMFDYIFLDESHILFNSQYRISTTSNAVKKLRQLFYIASNDPFAAKIVLMTGTPTGSEFFFRGIDNILRVHKKLLDKTIEFHICGDSLDTITRLAYKTYELLKNNHRLIIPTNRGDIYAEKVMGMVKYLLQREVKYGYYKRANSEQDICLMINKDNTVGDYEVIFCTNYLSAGIDISDTTYKFAILYSGLWNGYEIDQFNSRIRKQNILSYYFIQTIDSFGNFNEMLYEAPEFQLRLTDEDISNFKDDKEIASKKQEFLALYDPVLHNIVTPGFSLSAGRIKFNKEEYELINFENKYNECFQHPLKIASILSKYGYNIKVSTEFEGLDLALQKELKEVGIIAAKEEKLIKNDLLIGTFIDLIKGNKYISPHTSLEFNNTIEHIMKNRYNIIEDREMSKFVYVKFNQFAQPENIYVRSRTVLDKMIKPAHYLLQKYSENKCISILERNIDNGILQHKKFLRSVNLLKLMESHANNELSIAVESIIEKIYDFVDLFEVSSDLRIKYSAYMNFIDGLVNDYIEYLGIDIRTKYAWDKIREAIEEIFNDIAIRESRGKLLKFSYNTLPDQDSLQILAKKSIDLLIHKIFKVTDDIITSNKKNLNPRKKHIILEEQNY